MSESYRRRFSTILALAKHSDLNPQMALFDSKPDDGTDGRTR